MTSNSSLPRELKAGEFYCHECKTLGLLVDYDKHSKICHIEAVRKHGN